MKRTTYGCLLVLTFSFSALATPPTRDQVKKLLKVTKGAELADQIMQSLISNFKTKTKGANEKFWTEFRKEIDSNSLMEKIIPIYQKYLTDKDVADLTKFYEGETGRRFIAIQPQLVGESMAVGQQWGMETAQKLQAKLKKKGYLKDESEPERETPPQPAPPRPQ